MKKHGVTTLTLGACLAIGWLGCVADAPSESVDSTSQAAATPPRCDGPTQYVYAHWHQGPGAPGQNSPYTVGFPAVWGPNGVFTEEKVHNYEVAVWNNVLRANSYEYLVTWSQKGQTFLGVGINEAASSQARYDKPTAGNSLVSAPTGADLSNEETLSSNHPDAPISAQTLTCVMVVAYDGPKAGEDLEFFPLMDLHDPYGPTWIAP